MCRLEAIDRRLGADAEEAMEDAAMAVSAIADMLDGREDFEGVCPARFAGLLRCIRLRMDAARRDEGMAPQPGA